MIWDSDQVHFNSRPHEEVDWRSIQKLCRQHISTHDLTKRSTQRLPVNQPCITFQLTTSRRGRLHGRNSNHHVPTISTHDLTKRSTCRVAAIDHNCYFNSRPRKEVDFLGGKLSTPSVPFQLTTSQGGRHQQDEIKNWYLKDFNSRPRKEVDHNLLFRIRLSLYFNSRPRKEVDLNRTL